MYHIILVALQQQVPHHDLPHHTDGGVWWTHWLWLVFLGLIVAVMIGFLVVGMRRRSGASARDVLDRRYAQGEISTQEYEERKRRL